MRQLIFEINQDTNRGVRVKEISRLIPLPWSTLRIALIRLETVGLVRSYKGLYYPTAESEVEIPFEEIEILPLEKDAKLQIFLEGLR
ncbi:MAG: hypothetical protein R2827_07195 [Bdellovibrionales bacterium]